MDPETYNDYLCAADVAIQLRKDSRGETSRAVLDCMAVGTPVIVNAHGTAAELPDHAVCKLPDRFLDKQLTSAIDELFESRERREELGKQG